MYDLEIAARIGLKPLSELQRISNLATPTSKTMAFRSGKPLFFDETPPVPVSERKNIKNETSTRPRLPQRSLCGFPYHPAILVPEDPADQVIEKPWHIRFYAWDMGLQRLVRKRIFKADFDKIQDVHKRRELARGVIESVNYFLKHNYHLETPAIPKLELPDFTGYSLVRALQHAIDHKDKREGLAESTIEGYTTVLNDIKNFLEYKRLSRDYPLSAVNYAFVDHYFEYLTKYRGLANSTHNWYKGMLHALFQVLIVRSQHKVFSGVNPVDEINVLKTVVRKHAAFSDAQLRDMVDLSLDRGHHDVALYMKFMYYTLARPDEIRLSKIGHIDMKRRQMLMIVENAKTKIEEYVGIPDQLAKIIQESGILRYPPQYYIFSNDQVRHREVIMDKNLKISHEGRIDQKICAPGLQPVGVNYFPDRIRTYIKDLDLYSINSHYTPYAIKHTGAIGLYRATKDIEIVKQQCRHQNLETTIKYLRDLGIFTDMDQLNKWEGPI